VIWQLIRKWLIVTTTILPIIVMLVCVPYVLTHRSDRFHWSDSVAVGVFNGVIVSLPMCGTLYILIRFIDSLEKRKLDAKLRRNGGDKRTKRHDAAEIKGSTEVDSRFEND